MNPIKTPQEMMFEQAGIPHMAGGGVLSAGAKQLFDTAVKRFRAVNNRAPNAQELAQLESHAKSFSAPTSTGSGLNEARLQKLPNMDMLVDERGFGYKPEQGPRGLTTPEQARGYQVDPFGMSPENLAARNEAYQTGTRKLKTKIGGDVFAELPKSTKVLDDRDPFLTEYMTERSPTRTRQKPFTVSLDDLTTQRAAEEAAGKFHGSTETTPGGYPAQSVTPSADFFAERSAAIENAKLPINIRSLLREKLGREPSEDEINAFIANLNVAGADYTGKGAAIMGERPQYGAGRLSREAAEEKARWAQEAIDSGMSPSAVTAKPAELEKHYPRLLEEMKMGPNPKKEGGHITPTQMAHAMLVMGQNPTKFAGGRSTGRPDYNEMIKEHAATHPDFYDLGPKFVAREPDANELFTDVLAYGKEKMGSSPQHARLQADRLNDVINLGTMFMDPLSIPRGMYEVAHGEPLAGAIDIGFGVPGAYTTYKTAQAIAPKVSQATKALPKVGGALSRVLGPLALALTPSELGDSTLDAWNKKKANK